MARLGKGSLIAAVLQAVRLAGWSVDVVSPSDARPIRFTMSKGGETHAVRVYIWNLTHGGGSRRPKHEYRIQIPAAFVPLNSSPTAKP